MDKNIKGQQDVNMNRDAQATNKKGFMDKAGEAVERIGDKVSGNLGRKIHDVGDKMERTHSNPSHDQTKVTRDDV